jgi:hypothetical protein
MCLARSPPIVTSLAPSIGFPWISEVGHWWLVALSANSWDTPYAGVLRCIVANLFPEARRGLATHPETSCSLTDLFPASYLPQTSSTSALPSTCISTHPLLCILCTHCSHRHHSTIIVDIPLFASSFSFRITPQPQLQLPPSKATLSALASSRRYTNVCQYVKLLLRWTSPAAPRPKPAFDGSTTSWPWPLKESA